MRNCSEGSFYIISSQVHKNNSIKVKQDGTNKQRKSLHRDREKVSKISTERDGEKDW